MGNAHLVLFELLVREARADAVEILVQVVHQQPQELL
jgi:cellobiose-specific phosphotransferase system component IIA